jgi:6-pyruvoyltetrahydropterin/6-carboxytetrahydropterin synthase
MYELTISTTFSAAHRVGEEALHGHNFSVQATVSGKKLDPSDMLIDFSLFEAMLFQVTGALDHRLINALPAFEKFAPSAENMARHIKKLLAALANRPGLAVTRVLVRESEDCASGYVEAVSKF